MTIKRKGLNGVDNELYNLLTVYLGELQDRMIFHTNNDLYYQLLEIIKAKDAVTDKVYTFKFKRHNEIITIEVGKNELNILYEGVDNQNFLEEITFEIYNYGYKNYEEIPEIYEEGDFFIFCEKFVEHLKGIDVDNIHISIA